MKKIGLGFAAAGFSSYANTARATPGKKPNIIFMVVDNMGREAVGYYDGGTIVQDREKIFFKTPRLDKLASEGVVFENCLIATPLCAPARCGWNTGRHDSPAPRRGQYSGRWAVFGVGGIVKNVRHVTDIMYPVAAILDNIFEPGTN